MLTVDVIVPIFLVLLWVEITTVVVLVPIDYVSHQLPLAATLVVKSAFLLDIFTRDERAHIQKMAAFSLWPELAKELTYHFSFFFLN